MQRSTDLYIIMCSGGIALCNAKVNICIFLSCAQSVRMIKQVNCTSCIRKKKLKKNGVPVGSLTLRWNFHLIFGPHPHGGGVRDFEDGDGRREHAVPERVEHGARRLALLGVEAEVGVEDAGVAVLPDDLLQLPPLPRVHSGQQQRRESADVFHFLNG